MSDFRSHARFSIANSSRHIQMGSSRHAAAQHHEFVATADRGLVQLFGALPCLHRPAFGLPHGFNLADAPHC
jgi:hypothetical protein